MDTRALGRLGEDEAARHLTRLGFDVVDRNYRCSLGEIDLVLARGNLVVFCEVKTRATDAWGLPAEAVNARKQLRIRRLAGRWLATHRRRGDVRFDVVSVIVRGGRVEVRHFPAAF